MARRTKNGQSTKIKHKDIDMNSLIVSNESFEKDIDNSKQWVAKLEKQQAEISIEGDLNDLELQRDLAFKILYFFIVFILFFACLVVALLYLMKADNQREVGDKKPRVQNREPFASDQSPIFSLVSTYAMLDAGTKSITSKMRSSVSAQRVSNIQQVNNGFGGNGLAHLENEERGRFDNIEFWNHFNT